MSLRANLGNSLEALNCRFSHGGGVGTTAVVHPLRTMEATSVQRANYGHRI